jgi:dGTP triphosphohydrolase
VALACLAIGSELLTYLNRRRSIGETTIPKRTSDFREDLLADLADPEEAAHYLNAALEDSGQMALIALRDLAEARQMAKVAKQAESQGKPFTECCRSEDYGQSDLVG